MNASLVSQQEHLKQAPPIADWQQEKEEEEEPPEKWHVKEEGAESFEDWQQEVEEEEVEPLQDWRQEAGLKESLQQELEEGEVMEEAGSTVCQVHDGRENRKEKKKPRSQKVVAMGLPFLTGISPAGFLSANKKQPGGTDHLIRVTSAVLHVNSPQCLKVLVLIGFILQTLNTETDSDDDFDCFFKLNIKNICIWKNHLTLVCVSAGEWEAVSSG